jgi:putative transposase
MGLLVGVVVHPADLQDRDGAKLLLGYLDGWLPRLRLIWADGGYAGKLVDWVQQTYGWLVEVVRRTDAEPGFEVLPKRWLVERTFGWFNRYRRLSKDYEVLEEVSEAFVYIASIHLMLRRLTR